MYRHEREPPNLFISTLETAKLRRIPNFRWWYVPSGATWEPTLMVRKFTNDQGHPDLKKKKFTMPGTKLQKRFEYTGRGRVREVKRCKLQRQFWKDCSTYHKVTPILVTGIKTFCTVNFKTLPRPWLSLERMTSRKAPINFEIKDHIVQINLKLIDWSDISELEQKGAIVFKSKQTQSENWKNDGCSYIL